MDLEARPYRYFVTIAEKGSFSAAAEVLHVSQPALSAQIRELERRLGFALFTRTSRRVALTGDGIRFLDYARRMIFETEFVTRAARDIRTNPLRIGAAHFTALIPERVRLIEDFLRAEPAARVSVNGRNRGQLLEELQRHMIDLAITLDPDENEGEGSVVEPGFSAELVERISYGRRPLGVILPAEHPLAKKKRVAADALRGVPVCAISRAHGIALSEMVARRLNDAGAEHVPVPEGDAVSVIRYGALRRLPVIDLGWFPIPDGFEDGPMVRRPVDGWATSVDLIVVRARHGQHPMLEEFWRVATAWAGSAGASPDLGD